MNDNNNIPLFNFLDAKLTPSATCQSPATDNYEVDNLISDDITKKNLGFLAYSAIKPPVEIEFKFICPVNIYYIMVKTTVGSQKSTGIEIMAKNVVQNYIYISKSIHKKSGVYFCDSKIYSADKYPKNYNANTFNMAYFNRSSYKVFLEATCLKLKIFQTDRSVPCIGAIEVWGIPAKCCSDITKKTIKHIMMKKNSDFCCIPNKKEQFYIPDDFKDDLTYEPMSIPFTLPCGKTIDQSTLDKHIKSENQFGRKPCDPFTGIKFSEKMKPVLNMALKSRIDMFMIQNYSQPELNNYKRALGGSKHSNNIENKNKKIEINKNFNLEDAIASIKESPNFINITSNDVDKLSCVKCFQTHNFLYKIGCEHFYCRQCLMLILKDSNCSSCQKIFCTKDVERVHL